MKKYLYILILFTCFFGCSAQKKYKTINEDNYSLIATFSLNEKNSTYFLKNEIELKDFYKSLNNQYVKSVPRITVDFTKNQVAMVQKDHIDSYNIDFISGTDKIFQVNLSLLSGINSENDSSNFLMIVIPKTIKKITTKENN